MPRPWRYGLGIEAGELRAGLTWSRLLAGSGVARGYEVLDLGDNQGVVCQFATGRSSRSPLNVLLRRHAAYEAVGGFRMRCAWVPTHRQPSDAGTRADDHGWLYQGIALWKSITLLIAVGWDCRLLPVLERPRRRLTAYELPRSGGTVGFMRAWIRRVVRDIESGNATVVWWHWPRLLSDDPAHSIDRWLERMCGWCLDLAVSFGAIAVVSGSPANPCWNAKTLQAVVRQQLSNRIFVRCHYPAATEHRSSNAVEHQHPVSRGGLFPEPSHPCHSSPDVNTTADTSLSCQQHIMICCSRQSIKRRLAQSCSTSISCGVAAHGLGGRLGIPAAVARCLGWVVDAEAA